MKCLWYRLLKNGMSVQSKKVSRWIPQEKAREVWSGRGGIICPFLWDEIHFPVRKKDRE